MNDFLKKWSEKFKEPIEALKKEYLKTLEDTKSLFPDLSEEDQEKVARQQVRAKYRRRAISTAARYCGVVFGRSKPFDTNNKRWKAAKQLFKRDPQKAISLGYTDEDGTPLDNVEFFSTGTKNRNYGLPLKENFLFKVFGVASRSPLKSTDKLDWKPFVLIISRSPADPKSSDYILPKIPTFVPVEFFAIESDVTSNPIILNYSALTEFQPAKNIEVPPPKTLFSTALKDHKCKIDMLAEWHNAFKDDFNRFVVFDAFVLSLDPSISPFGSWTMWLDDEKLDEKDLPPVKCYVPEFIKPNFSSGSKLMVCGQTSKGTKSNPDEIVISVLGIYAYPQYLIKAPEVQEIKKEDLEPEKVEESRDEVIQLTEEDFD